MKNRAIAFALSAIVLVSTETGVTHCACLPLRNMHGCWQYFTSFSIMLTCAAPLMPWPKVRVLALISHAASCWLWWCLKAVRLATAGYAFENGESAWKGFVRHAPLLLPITWNIRGGHQMWCSERLVLSSFLVWLFGAWLPFCLRGGVPMYTIMWLDPLLIAGGLFTTQRVFGMLAKRI